MPNDVDKVHVWESFRALATGCVDPDGDAELAKRFGVGSRWMKRTALTRADRDKVRTIQANLSAAFAWGMRERRPVLHHRCFQIASRLFFSTNFNPPSPQPELFDGFKVTP